MGVFNRIRTAQRTASDSVPLPGEDEWLYDQRDAAESALRDAVCAIARDGTYSTTQRGWTSPIVAAVRSYTSTAWYSACDRQYELSLGVLTTTGPQHDWTIQAGVEQGPAGEQSLRIDTTERLTRDGKLQNGRQHDDLRQALREFQSHRTFAVGPNEQEATKSGLANPQEQLPREADLTPRPGLTVTTALSCEEIRHAMNSVPLRLLTDEPNSWTFALSPLAPSDQSVVTARLTDLGDRRQLEVTSRLTATGDELLDRVLARARFSGAAWVAAPINWLDAEAIVEKHADVA